MVDRTPSGAGSDSAGLAVSLRGVTNTYDSGVMALGLHIYEHGKAQADSNAKPQTGSAPNEG